MTKGKMIIITGKQIRIPEFVFITIYLENIY